MKPKKENQDHHHETSMSDADLPAADLDNTKRSEKDSKDSVSSVGNDQHSLESEVAELKDRLLRMAAEMENLRKRHQREIQDIQQFAVTNFAKDILSVADNLERALSSINPPSINPTSINPTSIQTSNIQMGGAAQEGGSSDLTSSGIKVMVEGIEMTLKSLVDTLGRYGVKKINSQPGTVFDHNLHQAMMEVPNSNQVDGAIVQVFQEGYILHERLLRPALVSVAKQKQ